MQGKGTHYIYHKLRLIILGPGGLLSSLYLEPIDKVFMEDTCSLEAE